MLNDFVSPKNTFMILGIDLSESKGGNQWYTYEFKQERIKNTKNSYECEEQDLAFR